MIELKGEVYLNTKESATHVNKARQTVYQYWKQWGWKPYYVGSTLLFKKSNIDNWLAKNLVPGIQKNSQKNTEYAV